jgi:hypothetical protein
MSLGVHWIKSTLTKYQIAYGPDVVSIAGFGRVCRESRIPPAAAALLVRLSGV